MKTMIKVDDLKELVRTVLYTGYVEHEKPLSVMFIADVGSGKSSILNIFKTADNIAYFTDVTYMGLIKLLEDNKEVRHIVIPDFLKITMKKQSTTDNIVSCFNAGMEEGIDKISMMGQSFDFHGKKFGLITATTKGSFRQNKRKWEAMGLLSRMLIVTFSYSDETIEEIFEYIINRRYLQDTVTKESMPYRNIEVKLPPELAKQLRELDTDFRKQKQLQTLVMARPILRGDEKPTVTQEDIDTIKGLSKYLNMEYTKI